MTTAATREPAGAGRIASLDGLRAISILAVLFGHLLGTRGFLPDELWKRAGIGDLAHLGVRVFFVISGFLITSLLLQEMDRTRRIDLKAFYVRRVYRIFPAFYAYLIIIFIASGVGVVKVPLDDAIFAATYTINYDVDRSWYVGHTWSLSVEEQFYMLWPATIWLAGVRRGLWASAVVVVIAPIIRIGWFYVFPSQVKLIGEAFPTVADSIALGCLLAGARDWLERQPFYAWLMRTPAFVVVPLLAVAVNSQASHARAFWLVGETVVNVSIAITVHRCILTPDGPVGRVLNSRVLVYIGTLSYSIYLWQQPFLDRSSEAFINRFPQNIILGFVAALASYYLIEKPFLRLRHRLSSARKSPTRDKPAPA